MFQSIVFVLMLLVTAAALLRNEASARIKLLGAGVLALLLLVGMACQTVFDNMHQTVEADVPPRTKHSGFATSNACRSCHPEQHRSWYRTFHRTMTQVVSPEVVVAPFEDVELTVEGQVTRLFRKDDEFWVDMVDPEVERAVFQDGRDVRNVASPPRVRARIVMTTGSHNFQAYWIRSPYGRELWQFPWRWHLAEQRWVHRRDVFLGPPEWRPGMHFKVWNDNCIFCHSTGGQPGRNSSTGYMEYTQVAELGIACESCHGPGEAHVQVNQNPLRRYSQYSSTEHDASIVNPATLPHDRSSEVCGSCHSNFIHGSDRIMSAGSSFRPGRELAKYGRFYRPAEEPNDAIVSRFWADGVNRSTGREFMGMKESACYLQGDLSCLSCHSMHHSDPNDQLSAGMRTNEACYQCHDEYRQQLAEHTHHEADSSGSQCYNCHMPHTNYGLFKATRSHYIGVPGVASIEHKSRPNACNLCHLDKTLSWTSVHLNRWYKRKPTPLSEDEERMSAATLWLLRGDAGQRVVTAWHVGWQAAQQASGKEWLAPFVAPLLNDPYAAVRWVAYGALRTLPGFGDFQYDFASDAEDRAAAATGGYRLWEKAGGMERRERAAAAFGASTSSLQEEISRVLQARDDVPISSVE